MTFPVAVSWIFNEAKLRGLISHVDQYMSCICDVFVCQNINTTSYAGSDKKQDVGVWKDYDTIHSLEHEAAIISPNKPTMQLSGTMVSGCGLMCHAF